MIKRYLISPLDGIASCHLIEKKVIKRRFVSRAFGYRSYSGKELLKNRIRCLQLPAGSATD